MKQGLWLVLGVLLLLSVGMILPAAASEQGLNGQESHAIASDVAPAIVERTPRSTQTPLPAHWAATATEHAQTTTALAGTFIARHTSLVPSAPLRTATAASEGTRFPHPTHDYPTRPPLPTELVTRQPTPTPDENRPLSFRGPIEAMSAVQWLIAGQVVHITQTTHLSGATPAVGSIAAVFAFEHNGTLLAQAIIVEPGDETHQAQFVGVIQMLDHAAWLISGYRVLITNTTIMTGVIPVVGAPVAVEAHRLPNHFLVAEHLTVGPVGGHPQFSLHGRVEVIMPQLWVIAGHIVHVDSHTAINQPHGPAQPGSLVEARVEVHNDGALYALSITVDGLSGEE